MKEFKYTAKKRNGAVIKGVVKANSESAAVDILHQKDLIVLSVSSNTSFSLSKLNEINIGGVPIADKVLFMRQLATMISAGVALPRALEILEDQALNPLFKKILGEVLAMVENGESLASAFRKQKKVFDDVVINLFEAGESSGKLEEILEKLAVELEEKKKLQDKIKSAFSYPIILLGIIIVVVLLLMIFLVPAMQEVYGEFGGDLPWVTQALINTSNFIIKFWWLLLILFMFVIVIIKLYLDSPSGKKNWHTIALKIPVFGTLWAKMQIAQFSRILALLLSSGLSIVEALDLTAKSLNNVNFRSTVLDAKKEVEKGSPLSLPIIRSPYFPKLVGQMIAVGEESGKLTDILSKLSDFYKEEVNIMTKNLSTMLEPLMLVIMGVLVGFIAAAVYMPMFNLAKVFGS